MPTTYWILNNLQSTQRFCEAWLHCQAPKLMAYRPKASTFVLPAVAALSLLTAAMTPAVSLSAEPEVLEVLPAEVGMEVFKLNQAVSQLEAQATAMAQRVKPRPDALDKVGGAEGKAWRVLRSKASGMPTSIAGDIQDDLESANARIVALNGSMDLINDTIDTRRALARALPLARPVNGIISSVFGARTSPITAKAQFHAGVDIAAPKGSAIVAPADGVVLSVDPHHGYGQEIVLDHGHGVTTVFAHLSRIDVKEGMAVKRGQTIALIGTTGKSTGPHLHYEVRIDDQPVDPQPFLSFDLARAEAVAVAQPGT